MSWRKASLMLLVFVISGVARGDAFPVPLTALFPAGSMIYMGSTTGDIGSAGEIDSFTLSLDSGQTITVALIPDLGAGLQPSLELRDPANNVIATATAPGPNQETEIFTAPVATAGNYTIKASGNPSGATGAYTLSVFLNLDFQKGINHTLATAQNLAGATPISSSADRLAVFGSLGATGTPDYYSFDLSAGQSATIALRVNPGSSGWTLELRDGTDSVLATGLSGYTNVGVAITNFVAATAGTYFVRIGNSMFSHAYSLVICRGATFDLEANDTIATEQSLGPNTVLGAIGASDADFFSFSAGAGQAFHFATVTPAEGPGEFVNTLNPHLELIAPSGVVIATGVPLCDGKNEEIFFTAGAAGTYHIRVTGEGATVGEYVLTPSPLSGPPCGGSLTAASPAHVWIGLKSSDDQGTQFDLKVELTKNGSVVASGLTRCITGVTRNASLAKEAVVSFDPFSPVDVASGDVLALNVSTRIGTNSDNTKCAGHNAAAGLRLYYDSTNRPSRFDTTITPDASKDDYLHSDGTVCGSAQSSGVTTRSLDNTAPAAANPRCKDSGSVNFSGGNPFSLIGTWSLAPLP